MLVFIAWVSVAAGLLAALYTYLTATYDYWESRGIKGPKPIVFFGTIRDMLLHKCSMGHYVTNVYNAYKNEPLVGIFVLRKPQLVISDLDLIKDILIKDFSKFSSRGIDIHEKVEPLGAHLFNLEPERWRPLRYRLSPVFTSGKLKEMFYLLSDCAEHLIKVLEERIISSNDGQIVTEVREITAKFTTDVIGVCAFGLQMNALATEDSPFRAMGRRIFEQTFKRVLNFRLRVMAPKLYSVIGRFVTDRELNDFFVGLTRDTMDYRKKNNIVRHDFVDLLMEIRDHPEKMTEVELTENILAAQLFVFFLAGFETSSTTMSNALYELAMNQEMQDKLRAEIMEEDNRTGGVVEYEGIKNMKYLDMIVQETLRKYPPLVFLMRQSTEPYTFRTAAGNEVLTIEKDQKIWIPVYGIQRNPKYYPEPEVFDPERFTPEAIKSRNPMTYLSFGDGPRNCIGKRFGVMQTKVGLVKILQNYRVERCEKTQVPYVVNPKTFLLSPKGGIWLKIVKLDSASTGI